MPDRHPVDPQAAEGGRAAVGSAQRLAGPTAAAPRTPTIALRDGCYQG